MEIGACGSSIGFSSLRKRCHLDFLAAVEDAVEETELRALFSACAFMLALPLREYAAYVAAIVVVVWFCCEGYLYLIT